MSAKSKIINNVRYITAKVAGKPVNISEASIRSDLLFDDADGIDSLHNQAIFDAIQLMGYEGDLTVLTFNKALFSPQWRFLFHTMNHCISSKSTSWDQIPTNIATAVICLATNQKYNFSKLIFDGMMRHLDAKKKFVMYPRFISVFLDKQLKNVPVPLDHFPINALTSKVFSFMVKKGKHFSGNVTPLFESMLVQPTEDEGEASERQSEPQPTPSPPHPSADQHETQPDPSPRPSPTIPIPDSIPEGSGGNHGGQSSSDRSLSGNEDGLTLQSVYDLCVSLCKQVTTQAAQIKDLKSQIKQLKKKAKPVITHHKAWMKSVSMKQRLAGKKSLKKKWMQKESVSKQGRKPAKSEPTVHKDPAFDDLDDDAMDYMETDAYMQRELPEVSTAKPKEVEVSTDKLDEGTAEPKDGTSDESTAPTTVFRDDETIAEFLVSMSQNKAKQKGVEIKDVEDSDRPRATSTRSVLTLKPLLKIYPKDKGKKVLEEEAESDAESEGVDEAKRKFDQLAKDEEIARKVQEDWEAEEEMKNLSRGREETYIEERAKFLYDITVAQRRFLSQQRAAAIRSRPPTRTQLRNQMITYLKQLGGKSMPDLKKQNYEELQVSLKKRLYEACGVCILEHKNGTVIYMLVERRYPISKELLQRMLDLGLEVEEEMRRVWVLANHHTTNGLQFTMSNRHQELTSPEANGFCEELASPGSNSSMTISLCYLKKSVVNIMNTSTNKAFQVSVDPSRLQSPFNGRYKLFAPCHVLLSPESRIHTRIEPLDLEFLDSIIQCFQNTCQHSITKLVYLIKPHDLSVIVSYWEHYCSRSLNDGIIMLELVAFSIPS
ncbi:hypothetical protein Tco_0990923 [Tanacetum coccineum]|uniref:Uncharacterized protein n=1 Tax=Tanacetum coccineum TaxID=301880 RepID=A0ABQ5EYG9_9ASTR